MFFIQKLLRSMRQYLGAKRRNVTRTLTQNHFRPNLETLEERTLLSTYWWRPDEALQVNNQNLVSVAGNWRNGSDSEAAAMTQAPGANDELRFRALGSAVFDPDASGTYATISILSGCQISVRKNVTFTGDNGTQTARRSYITGGAIFDPQLGERSMAFSGSPLTLSGGSFSGTIILVNSTDNEISLEGYGGYFSTGSKLVNNGTINWTEGGWEIDASTIENSGTINITAWNGATIEPGEAGLTDFNNLNGGTINIIGEIAVNIDVKTFTNAGTLNFSGESITTFKVNSFTQTAGAINISDNSVVDVQVEEDGNDTSATMTVNGGSVGGTGTIKATLQVGQATIRPGTTTTAGTLSNVRKITSRLAFSMCF